MNPIHPITEVVVFLLRIKKKRNEVALSLRLRDPEPKRLDGYRGTVKYSERAEHAAVRALAAQAGIYADQKRLRHCAVLKLIDTNSSPIATLHVFTCRNWSGSPSRTEQRGFPSWIPDNEILYKLVVPEYAPVLPQILAGEKMQGVLMLNHERTEAAPHTLNIMDSL